MGKLDGKVALVTGSGRGIGRAIVEKLASEGARIVVNDLDADPAPETVEALRKQGTDAVACVGNVTVPDFMDRFINTAMSTYKGIDIIVNNADYTWNDVIQKMTDEQWYCHYRLPHDRAVSHPARHLSAREGAGRCRCRCRGRPRGCVARS